MRFAPYQTGDLVWVRETFGPGIGDSPAPQRVYVAYRANGEYPERLRATHVWRPSIFMPRWASRLTLRVTDVRAERLQDICEEEAVEEGALGVDDFSALWDSINGKKYPWSGNPWVWVITFERGQP